MLYILCEDSSMGYDFWKKINSECLSDKAHLHTSKGNSKLEGKLDSLPLTSNDSLLCIFDNINNKIIYKFLNKLKNDSHNRKYKLLVSNYYCIEEMFLSFHFLQQWLNICDTNICNICIDIHNFIYNVLGSVDYTTNPKLMLLYPNATNREQMASYFLTDISRHFRNGFNVQKNKLDRCWYCSCKSGKQIPFYCIANNCYLYHNNMIFTPKEKLEHFWNNSILHKGKFSLSQLRTLC